MCSLYEAKEEINGSFSYFKLIKVLFSLFHYFLPVSLRVPLHPIYFFLLGRWKRPRINININICCCCFEQRRQSSLELNGKAAWIERRQSSLDIYVLRRQSSLDRETTEQPG
uniref:Uncharacterized protein n=1 Tax=Picea sitchensis TaxID=3332 RepID=D5ABP3_PICSI|nr:unknown [Picea sitchensis]